MSNDALSIARRNALEAFTWRKRVAGDGLTHTGEDSEFIAVNPMANETDLLRRLGMQPASCFIVDGYWRVGGLVYFLQIHGRRAAFRSVGLYGRLVAQGSTYANLVAVTDLEMLAWEDVLDVTRAFLDLGAARFDFAEQLPDHLTLLG